MRKIISVIFCTLMIISTTPLSVVAEPPKSSIYGISYDWENFESDVLNLTGADTNEVNRDLEEAANYSGFNLETDQVLSGQTEFYLESWDGEGTYTIMDANNNSHSVVKKMTELSIRHGTLADIGFVSDWIDNNESIDVWLNANDETLFTLDALYTEYLDQNMVVRGGDLAVSGGLESDRSLEFRININAANESISPIVSASADFSFQFPNINSSLRLYDVVDSSNQNNETGLITGTYEASTGYSLSLSVSDIPTEDLGINLDSFNVQLTDNIPSEGNINGYMYDDYNLPEDAKNWTCEPLKSTEQIYIDSSENPLDVECGLFLPVPAGMIALLTTSMAGAFEGGIEQLSTAMSSQIESWLTEAGLGSSPFICGDGSEIPGEWVNDGEEDCSDGSDENEESEEKFTCGDGTEIPGEWVNDGEEDCADGSDEDGSVTPNNKFIKIVEALTQSNIQKTAETFIDRFEILMENNIPSTPILDLENLCGIIFHDGSKVVGFGIINNGRILLGSSVVDVKRDTIQMNVKYLDGDEARDAKSGIYEKNTISELAPESRHNLKELYDILDLEYIEKVTEEESGQLPGFGFMAAISLLVFTALFASRREE